MITEKQKSHLRRIGKGLVTNERSSQIEVLRQRVMCCVEGRSLWVITSKELTL